MHIEDTQKKMRKTADHITTHTHTQINETERKAARREK